MKKITTVIALIGLLLTAVACATSGVDDSKADYKDTDVKLGTLDSIGVDDIVGDSLSPPIEGQSLPVVILKLDDYGFSRRTHPGWVQTMSFLDEQNIVGTIGLLGKGLEQPTTSSVEWLQEQDSKGHELWNHGYCHCRPDDAKPVNGKTGAEFNGMDLSYQLSTLMTTQRLAKEKLGITLTAFGSPYNSSDEQTITAIEQIADLKVWMFKDTKFPTDKFVLSRIGSVNIEYPVHQPDFQSFKEGLQSNLSKEVLVIQGHPRSWYEDEARFDEFKKIVLFLKENNFRIMTPTGYAKLVGEI